MIRKKPTIINTEEPVSKVILLKVKGLLLIDLIKKYVPHPIKINPKRNFNISLIIFTVFTYFLLLFLFNFFSKYYHEILVKYL